MNADRLLAFYERIADAPDAIVRFRRFILDLAVRGKLVGQDPNDEPASELLKRIAAEKTRLVRAGQIRKQKAFPFLESPPFYVPENWRWARIREVTSDRGQKVPDAVFTYIDVTAIDKENGLIIGPRVLAPSEAPSRARKIIQRGDVIYSCVRPYLLNIAVIEDDYDPAPIASTAFAILNGHGFVLPRYLWITLRSPFMVACVEENQRGQAYPAINDADFAVLPLPLPPLAEQHRIVAKVDELMALCDQLEAARAEREATRDRLSAASLARLNVPAHDPDTFRNHASFALENLAPLTTRLDQIKALRQTILNLAVCGKLVEQDRADEPASELLKRSAAEKTRLVREKKRTRVHRASTPAICSDVPFDLPAGWSPVKIEQTLVEIQTGPFGSSLHQSDYQLGGTPVINPASIQNERIVPVDKMAVGPVTLERLASFKLRTGDVIMGRRGEMGRCAVVSERESGWLCGTGSLILRALECIYPRFLSMLIGSPFSRQYLGGTAVGTTMQNLNQTILLNLSFGIPPLTEQHRIVAKVDELMALCDRLEASLADSDTTRQRLLETLLHEALAPAAAREIEMAE